MVRAGLAPNALAASIAVDGRSTAAGAVYNPDAGGRGQLDAPDIGLAGPADVWRHRAALYPDGRRPPGGRAAPPAPAGGPRVGQRAGAHAFGSHGIGGRR